MNLTVLQAIFRRDFVSYFSNPTGYVFICVFVMLTSLATFWPPEFFSNNLANLDQLSRWIPFILLVFIPAISMSIWAEEKRQGTDELLLTLPATDFDVVLGKYLSSVAIYTVSLLFSMFSVFLVFRWGLGEPDVGLFIGSYLGYWFVGMAMISVGMVASFLTSNLTVGFILGILFNAPLALFGAADLIVKNQELAQTIRQWSVTEQFIDFERGVVTLSSVVYFLSIIAVMIYISMVLISKRHWGGREDGETKGSHYFIRSLCLLVVVGALNVFLSNHNSVRYDMTSEKLNSLSERTIELVRDMGADDEVPPVIVDAYVSPQVPAEYAAQKRNLLATLDELAVASGGKIRVRKHEIENFSEDATLAEKTYGIEARSIQTTSRGAMTQEEIFLGAAFSCGLDKVVLPFVDKGIPVEYEVVRSITTVAQPERKRVGVIKTAAPLFGSFSMQGSTPETMLIQELKKQYDVVEVDPTKAIGEKFDVLLAVQPSSLGPIEMDNFVAAVKSGQPTAIFEDPFPVPNFWGQEVVGTTQPNPPQGGGMMAMFGGGGPPKPKGDMNQLWNLIGVYMPGDEIVWQMYNPYPRAEQFIDQQWIFVDQGNGAENAFNPNEPIVNGLKQTLFLMSGSVRKAKDSKLEFTDLAVTGQKTGTISVSDLQSQMTLNRQGTNQSYIMAARVTGKPSTDEELALESLDKEEDTEGPDLADTEEAETPELNVVIVADIDCLSDAFFAIREMGEDQQAMVDWNFQNVALVLNILDDLAGDDRFLDVRKRTRQHQILTGIERATEDFRKEAIDQRRDLVDLAESQVNELQKEFAQEIGEIDARQDLDPIAKKQLIQQAQIRLGRSRDVKIASIEKERDRQIRQGERDLASKIRGVQDFFKMCAVVLPPIPPILLAFLVFFHRRESEREGVAKTRLRYGGVETNDTTKQ